MSPELERLALKKQLLVTRAALQRLQAANHVEKIRGQVRWPLMIAGAVITLVRILRR